MIRMCKLWLQDLYGQYGPRCPLPSERPLNLFNPLNLVLWTLLMINQHWLRCWLGAVNNPLPQPLLTKFQDILWKMQGLLDWSCTKWMVLKKKDICVHLCNNLFSFRFNLTSQIVFWFLSSTPLLLFSIDKVLTLSIWLRIIQLLTLKLKIVEILNNERQIPTMYLCYIMNTTGWWWPGECKEPLYRFHCRVSSGQGKVREIPDLAKVREKSGNFVEGQGKN